MQNFGERNGEGGQEGEGAQISAAEGSMEKGHVGRRIVDTTRTDMVSQAQEESQQNLMT